MVSALLTICWPKLVTWVCLIEQDAGNMGEQVEYLPLPEDYTHQVGCAHNCGNATPCSLAFASICHDAGFQRSLLSWSCSQHALILSYEGSGMECCWEGKSSWSVFPCSKTSTGIKLLASSPTSHLLFPAEKSVT